jgi:transcription antitermination factor NusG
MPDYENCCKVISCSRWIPDPTSPQWLAVAVKPRFDKAVARILESKGFQTFLPLYKKQRLHGSRRKESLLPLFPGYVFCRFHALTRLPVLTTPGVTQILSAGNTPLPVTETEIASLQTAIQARVPLQPFPFLKTGQKVRINKGALAGIEGIVMSSQQYVRLVISITLLQRSVLLEIDRDQVSTDRIAGLALRAA